MVQQLLPFLPNTLPTAAAALACVAAVAAGLFLWLLGGVWGRGIVALLAVALGGWLGMMLPRWYFWPINSMALATLGAVALGVGAFAVPRIGVGLLLGAVLAAWAGVGVWINLSGDQPFAWRQDWETSNWTLPQHAQDVWQRMPQTVQRPAPYAAATGLISGLAIALLWPRLSRALCFSVTGTSVFLIAGLILIGARRPDWLLLIPPQAQVQLAVLGVMVLAGVVVQWQFIPARKTQSDVGSDRPVQQAGPAAQRPVGLSVM